MFGGSTPRALAELSPEPPRVDELRVRFQDNLGKVRELLKDDLAKPENKMYDSDVWLLRFLFNPKYSAQQCADRFRAMMAKREADGVNRIMQQLQAQGDNASPDTFPHAAAVKEAFPESLFHASDIHGQPVAIQLYGRGNPKQLMSAITKDQFYEFALYKAEFMRLRLDALTHKTGRLMQWVQITDLEGLGMKHASASSLDFAKGASKQVDQMYKECLGKIYVVNAPTVFKAVWALMKVWVSERTAMKLTLLGGNYRAELVRVVPPHQLPAFLGGAQPHCVIGALTFGKP